VDEVFKALADPSRRKLLDRLRERDGQTLLELCRGLPMTRFGISKHLRVLERAGLVTTRRQGREKLHFLNPVPLRLIHDRWTSRYAAPFTRALGALKRRLEQPMADAKLRHVYEVYIRTTPEKLWQAMTDPAFTRQYFYGAAVESSWKPGAGYTCRGPDGRLYHEGKVLETDQPRKLVHTFDAKFGEQFKGDRPSRVTWLIEKKGEVCKLTLVHDDFDAETATYKSVGPGWNPVLSGLKTLLETGKPLGLELGS
jgi:DNA-binding transcriptional ArsR family regulator